MAKRGFPGMPGQMNNLMKQVQKMQREVEKKQEELQNAEYEASAGGGAVVLKMNGKREILEFKIEKSVVDPDDVEMLQDLIVLAINDVNKKIEEQSDAALGSMGMNIPGLM